MRRFSRNLVVILLLAVLAGAAIALLASGDPIYTLKEWINWPGYHRYDALINDIAVKNKLDPMLLKAVIWRESSFDPKMTGGEGERGLMQVSEAAAADWAKAQKIPPPDPAGLFDPATNINIGAWYLKSRMQNYSDRDDPTPFGLAEYNAGRTRVNQWLGNDTAAPIGAKQFIDKIAIPSTRKYVDTIEARYQFYKARGRM